MKPQRAGYLMMRNLLAIDFGHSNASRPRWLIPVSFDPQ
jgi:hypothetical protein